MIVSPAHDLLRDLAEKTRGAPEPPGSGRYHYVHTCGSALRTKHCLSRSGDGTVTGSVAPFERRQWIAADGSGRLEVTNEGRLVQPSGDYAAGQLAAFFVTDERSLGAALGRLTTKATTPAIVKALRQIWLSQVVPPSVQRLLLRRLAECAGLSPGTSPQDFAGKVAVTYVDEDRHVRHALAFDRDTGELAGTRATALEGARLPIPVPAVVSHTEWLTTGYCETTAEPLTRRAAR